MGDFTNLSVSLTLDLMNLPSIPGPAPAVSLSRLLDSARDAAGPGLQQPARHAQPDPAAASSCAKPATGAVRRLTPRTAAAACPARAPAARERPRRIGTSRAVAPGAARRRAGSGGGLLGRPARRPARAAPHRTPATTPRRTRPVPAGAHRLRRRPGHPAAPGGGRQVITSRTKKQLLVFVFITLRRGSLRRRALRPPGPAVLRLLLPGQRELRPVRRHLHRRRGDLPRREGRPGLRTCS